MLRAPIALFAFNRPETTKRVFEAVRAARPSRLFLICDGPRADRAGEAERCAAVRRLLEGVDWPCTVERDYSDANLGCRVRISSGIAWVFTRTEEAIFLEDDTLPDASFFQYCDDLLARYRDDARVLSISGYCPHGESPIEGDSYWFSAYPRIWGWAAWRRSWTGYDAQMTSWPAFKASGAWRGRSAVEREAFGPWFEAVYSGTSDTWDAQFVLLGLQRNALTVIPHQNLVMNLGFGPDATHTVTLPLLSARQVWSVRFPIVHPQYVRHNARLDDAIVRAEHSIQGMALTRATRRFLRRVWRWLRARVAPAPGNAHSRATS